MATENPDDDSCEKLLNESDNDSQGENEEEGEEEEDCVQLLLRSLEEDGGDISENWTERKKKLMIGDKDAETDVKLYLKKKYGNLADKFDESINGSVSELNASVIKLDVKANAASTSGAGNASSKKTVPVALLQRQKLAMKLLKQHSSETSRIVCGIVIMLLILGIGGSLLFLAFLLEMEDLYILGGIFSLGGIIFAIAFVVVRCQARADLQNTDYSVLYKA